MDTIIIVSVYLMIGIIFLKFYKMYFPDSYNFLCYMDNESTDYDKNKVYRQSSASIWAVLIIYPFIITWLIISRSLKYATRLIKWWVE